MRKSIAYIMALLAVAGAANASQKSAVPDYISINVPGASVANTGHAAYMLIDLYDATLYRPRDTHRESPLALSLKYLLAADSGEIADRAVEAMRNQGFRDEIKLAAWHEALRSIIPDVEPGTTLTGVLTKNRESVFYQDGRFIGKISDPQFGEHFFNIWLAQNTDEPIVWAASGNTF